MSAMVSTSKKAHVRKILRDELGENFEVLLSKTRWTGDSSDTFDVEVCYFDDVRDAFCELGRIENGHATHVEESFVIDQPLFELMQKVYSFCSHCQERLSEIQEAAQEKGL